jgi:hypothetical protein
MYPPPVHSEPIAADIFVGTWFDIPTLRASGALADFLRHEIGHALGFDHAAASDSIMYVPILPPYNTTFSAGDLASIHAIYGTPAGSTGGGMGGFGTGLWGGGGVAGVVSVTGTSLIYDALRLLGVLRPGQSPNADSLSDCLTWLNQLIDSWATERLMVKVVGRALIPMDGSAVYYAAFQHRIEAAGYVSSGGVTERPIDVYTPEEWRTVAQKVLAGEPSGVYPEYAVPEAILYPWPQPAAGDLYIYQWNPLEAFADMVTAYTLPAGYSLALRYNLAAQIAPAFDIIKKISRPHLDSIDAKAREYKGRIKSLNSVPPPMVYDNPLSGGGLYDILSGRQL